jgi:hypothetical protein
MKDPRAMFIVLAILGALAVGFSAGHVATLAHDRCSHTSGCRAGHEYCLADSADSTEGRCIVGKVLP